MASIVMISRAVYPSTPDMPGGAEILVSRVTKPSRRNIARPSSVGWALVLERAAHAIATAPSASAGSTAMSTAEPYQGDGRGADAFGAIKVRPDEVDRIDRPCEVPRDLLCIVVDDAEGDDRDVAGQGDEPIGEGLLQGRPICRLPEEASLIEQHLDWNTVGHHGRGDHHIHSSPRAVRPFDLAHKEAQPVAAHLARDRRYSQAVPELETAHDRAGRARRTFPAAIADPEILGDAEFGAEDDPGRRFLRTCRERQCRGAAQKGDKGAALDHEQLLVRDVARAGFAVGPVLLRPELDQARRALGTTRMSGRRARHKWVHGGGGVATSEGAGHRRRSGGHSLRSRARRDQRALCRLPRPPADPGRHRRPAAGRGA
jgi:hypothetical protein